jgi:integrase
MKIGLRTGEICSLRIEYINFEEKTFHVLDSKRKRLYPLPLDALTLQLIQDLVGSRKRATFSQGKFTAEAGATLKLVCPSTLQQSRRLWKRLAWLQGLKG